MANLFKSIMNRGDDDEELDLEFDIHEAESNCFELPPDRENNQVLAVWGSPASGKTTMAVKLARYIASQKKNVILLLADMTAPPLPYICPASDIEEENSLGAILGAAHVTENLIKQNACKGHALNERRRAFILAAEKIKPVCSARVSNFNKVARIFFVAFETEVTQNGQNNRNNVSAQGCDCFAAKSKGRIGKCRKSPRHKGNRHAKGFA